MSKRGGTIANWNTVEARRRAARPDNPLSIFRFKLTASTFREDPFPEPEPMPEPEKYKSRRMS